LFSQMALSVGECHYITAPSFYPPGIAWVGRPADHRYRIWASMSDMAIFRQLSSLEHPVHGD